VINSRKRGGGNLIRGLRCLLKGTEGKVIYNPTKSRAEKVEGEAKYTPRGRKKEPQTKIRPC